MRDFLTFEAHVEGVEQGHARSQPRPRRVVRRAGRSCSWRRTRCTAPTTTSPCRRTPSGSTSSWRSPPSICRDVRNVTPEQARAAIGGYCVMNDWSARDVQGREMKLRLGPSKGKDFATTIGPVGRHRRRARRAAATPTGSSTSPWRSGSTASGVGGDRSGHMGWSFEQLVSYASRASWVKAGEVLASGTCASRCARRDLGPHRPAAPAAAAGRRRRRDDDRAARHHPQPRSSPAPRRCRPSSRPAAASRAGGADVERERRDRPSDGPTVNPATGQRARVLPRPRPGTQIDGRPGRRAARVRGAGRRPRWPSGSPAAPRSASCSPSGARSTPP